MKILCYGDSNTYGYKPENQQRYSKRWPALIRNHEVINHGQNGQTLTYVEMEKRFASAQKSVHEEIKDKYDLIIIMLGTNDLKARYQTSNDYYEEAYRYVLNTILEKYPNQQILLLPLADIHINEDEWENAVKKRQDFNNIIKSLANNDNIRFLDYGKVDISDDKIHLSLQGHQQIAEKINEYLN